VKRHNQTIATYSTFARFYLKEVLPRKIKSADSRTLGGGNGQRAGKHPRPFGCFKHNKRTWVVDDRAWFLPLDIAYFFGADDSFKQEPPTGRRKRWRLVLNESIRQGMEVSLRQMGKQRRLNYVYIFEA
jgi:hypothetical protein